MEGHTRTHSRHTVTHSPTSSFTCVNGFTHSSSYIIDLVLSSEGRPFHPSIRFVIRPVIQVPHPWMKKMMEREDDDDSWRRPHLFIYLFRPFPAGCPGLIPGFFFRPFPAGCPWLIPGFFFSFSFFALFRQTAQG